MENTENLLKKRTKVFFDCEFTGLHQKTTLISIGLITETNRTFYAELTDFNLMQVDKWIEENVLSKLYLDVKKHNISEPFSFIGHDTVYKGNKKGLSSLLSAWLSQFGEIEMWSDCLAYDWVLFNDLFGSALDIPKNVYYIPFDICTLFKIKGVDPDINREKFGCGEVYSEMQKHNALWDAKVIKMCHEKLIAMEEYSKSSYSIEQVRELLQRQKEATALSLGYSSAVYIYPHDYSIMEKLMLSCPLVI